MMWCFRKPRTEVERLEQPNRLLPLQEMDAQMMQLQEHWLNWREQWIALVEENQRLKTENRKLQELLTKQEQSSAKGRSGRTQKSDGKEQLRKLYQEGFHICNVYYGHLRTDDDCLFCLSFLQKN